MEFHFTKLSEEYSDLTHQIDDLQQKDADIHRVIFGMEPIDRAVWEGGTGGSENLIQLYNNKSANEVLGELIDKAEKLKRKVKMQAIS